MLKVIFLLILGLSLLVVASRLLITCSSNIAKSLNVSDFVIGLTIVAIGTSLPELFICFTSAWEGHFDISFGNIIGSNIFNIFLILGISAFFKPILFDNHTKKYDIPLGIIFSILTWAFALTNNIITRLEALIMLTMFGIYMIYTLSSLHIDKKMFKNKKLSLLELFIYFLLILISVFLLKLGSDLVVDNAINIAILMRIREDIIGLSVIAIGTGLPEIVTTIVSLIKGKENIAIGNMIGSVTINTLLILGLSGLINPLVYDYAFNLNFLIAILGPILLWLFAYIKPFNKMTRNNGIVFLIIYLIYLVSILS